MGTFRKNLGVMGEYLSQVMAGTFMAAVLMLVSVGLHILTHWVETYIHNTFFHLLMNVLENTILYSDLVFIVWWYIYSTIKAIQRIIRNEDQ